MGGQNAKISKHSTAAKVARSISAEAFWRLRVRSVWVARMHGFTSILRRQGWQGAFLRKPYGGLGSGQYGWPDGRISKQFCGGKGGKAHFSGSLMAA